MGLLIAIPYALMHHLRDEDPLSSASFRSFLSPPLLTALFNSDLRSHKSNDNEVARSLKAMNDDTRQEIRQRKVATGSGTNVPLLLIKVLHQRLVALSKTP